MHTFGLHMIFNITLLLTWPHTRSPSLVVQTKHRVKCM